MKLWQIAALVVAGLIAGEVKPGYFGPLFAFATFHVFLPAIIFEAAWQLDLRTMLQGWRSIVLLAVPGVLITAAIVAASVHVFGGLQLGASLVLGAVLSATDPVAVTAIFRRLQVPELLSTIVESESLLNDAIAVVLYREVIAVASVAAVGGMTIAALAGQAVLGSLLGVVAGAAIGYVAALAMRARVPAVVQILLTFAAAYLAYGAVDAAGGSGIFATIACAMTMRELERRRASVQAAAGVERAWSVAATFSNAVLFFLIGAAVEVVHLWNLRAILGWTILGVLIARALLAYGLLQLAPAMLRSWMTVVRMAGVRGAVSLALALGVPASLPGANVITDATFGVVIVTILIGSLTYGRRIGRLDLNAKC